MDDSVMEHVSSVVSQSFDRRLQTCSSQAVPIEVVQCLRKEYLDNVRCETKRKAFLQKCSARLQASLTCIQPVACVLPVAYAYPNTQTGYYEEISFNNDFYTIGRQGDICIHPNYINVSRLQALLYVVAHTDGRKLLVILDWWSKCGTAIKGTAHCSLPNARRVLVAPVDQAVVLELGVVEPFPLSVVINPPECLICKSQPRTEVFETCGHLVACKSCFDEMTVNNYKCSTNCPICRQPVSTKDTRPARYEVGECQTCIVDNSEPNGMKEAQEAQKAMDALQSTVCRTPHF